MKITCTKEEYALIVRQCYSQMCCRGCALYGACKDRDSIVAVAEVENDAE